jgi:hypothetical protein
VVEEPYLYRLLRQRGHEVTRARGDSDILVPSSRPDTAPLFSELIFNLMREGAFMHRLRDWAYSEAPRDEFADIDAYVRLAKRFDRDKFSRLEGAGTRRQQVYAATFEWYLAQLLRRRFAARAAGFGLRLRDASPEDEFDCVGIIDDGLVYIECKTGKTSLFPEIEKFVRRDEALGADYSFFIFDRDWTFSREGDDLPDLTESQATSLGLSALQSIECPAGKFYSVQSGTRWFLASSGLRNLESRLRYMFHYTMETQSKDEPRDKYRHATVEFRPDDVAPPGESE